VSGNLDLVRLIYSDWERGDFSRVDWAHPEIVVTWADGPNPGTFTGLAGMAKGMREVVSAWEEWRVEGKQYCELDHERVLVVYRASVRGKASAVDLGQIQALGASLFHIRTGEVTKLIIYWDRDRALADLGLEADECQGPLDEIDLL
jgi:hypothetical protein